MILSEQDIGFPWAVFTKFLMPTSFLSKPDRPWLIPSHPSSLSSTISKAKKNIRYLGKPFLAEMNSEQVKLRKSAQGVKTCFILKTKKKLYKRVVAKTDAWMKTWKTHTPHFQGMKR